MSTSRGTEHEAEPSSATFISPFQQCADAQEQQQQLPLQVPSPTPLASSTPATASASCEASATRTPADVAFRRLCGLFEQLLAAGNRPQQVRALSAFWRLLPPQLSFFPYMRLLLPHLDTERPSYQLKESKLAAIYVEVLALSRRGTDAQRLLRWKDPAATATSTAGQCAAVSPTAVDTTADALGGAVGRFSDVVFDVVEHTGGYQPTVPSPSAPRTIAAPHAAGVSGAALGGPSAVLEQDARLGGVSVQAVNEFLDALAAADSAATRTELFARVVRHTTALEQRWLVRIILKDMHFGMTHQSMLAVFHPAALDKFNASSDLRFVCDSTLHEIQQPRAGPAESGVLLFHPLSPMLASPVTARKLEQLLAVGSILLEPKYDGERIMLHLDACKTMYWTRNTKNFTAYYGPKFDAVARTAFPVGARRTITASASTSSVITLENCILDGEFLVYDGELRAYLEFGLNRTFATATAAELAAAGTDALLGDGGDGSGRRWFSYIVFDLVLLNGQPLLHVPLLQRRRLLREVLTEQPTHLEVIAAETVSTTAQIMAGLEKAVEAKLEGVVLKTAESPYVPAERKLSWMKLKPDHLAGLADTLDLVVVGGYYGTKFGRSHLSHFLLASPVRGSAEGNSNVEQAVLHTVCRVGTGYTREELAALQAALEPYWERMPSRTAVPAWLGGWLPTKTELVPDFYVHPRHSLVVEVFGFAFTESAHYRVGFTIRFPRVLRIRWDKAVMDATSVAHLRGIMDASKDTLRRRLAETQDELLTVVSLRWKRRRELQGGPARSRSHGGGETGDDSQPLSASLRDAAAQLQPKPFATALAGLLEVTRRVRPEEVVSSLFAGYEFCVLYIAPGSAAAWRPASSTTAAGADASLSSASALSATLHDRALVEWQLQRHGGRVAANPTRTTSLLIGNSVQAAKVANWIQLCERKPAHVADKYPATDVVHLQWVMDCVEAGRVLPLAPRYVLYASPALKAKFAQLLDSYEDAWYDPCTPSSLRHSLAIAAQLHRREALREDAEPDTLVGVARRVRALRQELGLDDLTEQGVAQQQQQQQRRSRRPSLSPVFAVVTKDAASALLAREAAHAPASIQEWASAFLASSPCADVEARAAAAAVAAATTPPLSLLPHAPRVKRECVEAQAEAEEETAVAAHASLHVRGDDLVDARTGAVYRQRSDDTATWSVAQLLEATRCVMEGAGACVATSLREATAAIDDAGRWWLIQRGSTGA